MQMIRKVVAAGMAALVVLTGAPATAQTPPPAQPPIQAPVQAALQPLDRARVEAFVDGAVSQAILRDHIAGVSVAVVDRSGVVLAKAYGQAGANPTRPAGPDTLFRVGSISKTPVWIAVMQLVEQGMISLDDPINDHLPPDLKIPDEGFREPIRIRHLMTHSAGFEDSVLGGFFVRDAAHLTNLETYLRTHRVHRVREPGTLAVYSNYGAALAGAMVAHVTGQRWEDYVERHVLRPLGMAEATYREPYSVAQANAANLAAPIPAAALARLSSGFDVKAGALEPQAFEYIGNVAPAGGLSASARDMAAYLQALLDPARLQAAGVLKATSFATLREPLFANTPEMGSWRHGFMDFSVIRGRPAFGHGGDLIYQHATLEIYPDAGIGIFVAVNTPTGIPLRDHLPQALLAAFAGPASPPPPRAADAKAEAAKVAGAYRSLRRPAFRTERAVLSLIGAGEVKAMPNGDIIVPRGDHTARFYPIGHGVFADVASPARIAFHEVGGRMLQFDPYSAGPAERIGFFQGAIWLSALAVLALFTAIWGMVMGVRRLFRRREPGRAAALALDGLCAAWLIAFGFVGAGMAALGDQNSAVFAYPGTLLPVGLWALLAAALATPLAALAAIFPLRPHDWSAWRWSRQGAAFVVFATFAVTLQVWGLLGYSGW